MLSLVILYIRYSDIVCVCVCLVVYTKHRYIHLSVSSPKVFSLFFFSSVSSSWETERVVDSWKAGGRDLCRSVPHSCLFLSLFFFFLFLRLCFPFQLRSFSFTPCIPVSLLLFTEMEWKLKKIGKKKKKNPSRNKEMLSKSKTSIISSVFTTYQPSKYVSLRIPSVSSA